MVVVLSDLSVSHFNKEGLDENLFSVASLISVQSILRKEESNLNTLFFFY